MIVLVLGDANVAAVFLYECYFKSFAFFFKGRKSANNGELSGALLVLFCLLVYSFSITHECVCVVLFVLFTFLAVTIALLDQQ